MFDDTRSLESYKGKPLQGYARHEVQVIGQVSVDIAIEYGHQKKRLPLLIVAGNERSSLFGQDWMQGIQLDWAGLHQIREKVSSVGSRQCLLSKEVGKIKGYKTIIHLRQGTKPIFKKSRSVAYTLQSTLEVELNRMQQEGILEPVESSEWATPLVIVPKSNGNLRVCSDFKVIINQCVETKTYPLPTAEDFLLTWLEAFAHLAGGRVFTKLDLS